MILLGLLLLQLAERLQMIARYDTGIRGKAKKNNSGLCVAYPVKYIHPFLYKFATQIPVVRSTSYNTLQTRVNHETTDDR